MSAAPLKISRWGGAGFRHVDDVVRIVADAASDGFDGVWVPQTLSVDALTALTVAALAVPMIELGTAVVPIQGRHPITLSQQALTVAQVAGDRFTLGVGVTHRVVSEGFYGIPYDTAVALCAEQLEAMAGLLGDEHVASVTGEHLTARMRIGAHGGRVGMVLAALGPRMVELAGRFTDGTVTWMTGVRSLRTSIVPGIRAAAERAGRPAPRVIAGLPVCVTNDVAGARDRLRPSVTGAMAMPSYARMIGVEGFADPAEIGVIGDEAAVRACIDELVEVGVTELLASVVGTDDEQARTIALLTGLTGRQR